MTEQRSVVIERLYPASPARLWEMWTTAEGIESWWGPDGFEVEVHELDVTPGGKLSYSMKTVGPEQVEYLTQAGMPLITTLGVIFTDVVPHRRLAYTSLADFIPDTEPYEVGTTVELVPVPTGTKLILTIDAMHDDHWTNLAVMGWESELDRLRTALAAKEA
jgi:uncharacterized protein YndB with AHSA1/START domain